ncbi:hypothetical protein [Pukyongiella litopenaei]|uniref:BppU N-terminal domain-containing protein n=1 Tax=Pukyongiella litopenaei TaxID=2605946 RepID=A0A2S0ML85_9RHOB|nr:hypothetical protein [Pukyongiella litopenaei]AVO36587.1 hypothetical protein C6Y53_01980 [Pukyongiella litopenaei]
MVDFTLKRASTRPILMARLMTGSGEPIDLTGATVELLMSRNGVLAVDAACVIEDAPAGIVSYEWTAGNTITRGFYLAEIKVTYSDGGVEKFPNNRHLKVHIHEDLG